MPSHLGEDLVIEKLLGSATPGFYLDVGAYDPYDSSNTNHFYQRGWRGIDIEPIPSKAEKFRTARPEDIIVECVVGSEEKEVELFVGGELTTLHFSIVKKHMDSGFSSFSPVIVKQRTLNSILLENKVKDICFISMDVEGSEVDALLGLDLKMYRPKVMCIEATLPNSKIPNWDNWEPYVLSHNYALAHFDGYNRFYVRGGN